MKQFFTLGFIVFASLFLAFCERNNEETLYPETILCDTTNVSYSASIAPIIASSCALSGCHVQGGTPPILENYTHLKTIADDGRLNNRVIVQQNMPPSNRLNDCNIKLIDAWIKAGAPNN